MSDLANISREKYRRFGLSTVFFYILILTLPLGTKKIFFTAQSFYFEYHAFYNTTYVYLTDLVFLGLIIAWIWEKQYISREKEADKSAGYIVARPFMGNFHRIITRIQQDKIYWFLFTFWLILVVSLVISREMLLGLYGLVKITEFILIFAYIRENLSVSPARLCYDEVVAGGRETPGSDMSPRDPIVRPHQADSLQDDNKINLFVIFWLILASFWFQAGLGIWQFVNQGSAGLSWLGEEYLRPGLPGIAEFVSRPPAERAGETSLLDFAFGFHVSGPIELIRAYGTLPHPNVLAGLLFLGVTINLYMLYVSPRTRVASGDTVRGRREKLRTIILCLSLILLTTGLVVTFSRFVWGVTLFAIISWFLVIFVKVRQPLFDQMRSGEAKNKGDYHPGRLALIALILLVSLGLNLMIFGRPVRDRILGIEEAPKTLESFSERQVFTKISREMIKQNLPWGVGLKNFVVRMDDYADERLLPYLHQPVHNLYLLIAAEEGLVALFVFLVILFYLLKNIVPARDRYAQSVAGGRRPSPILKYTFLVVFFGMLALAFFDHYFWTIQQGSLAFWLIAGMLAAKSP